jgi:hypothetical protein
MSFVGSYFGDLRDRPRAVDAVSELLHDVSYETGTLWRLVHRVASLPLVAPYPLERAAEA